jgi:hypothetical protein
VSDTGDGLDHAGQRTTGRALHQHPAIDGCHHNGASNDLDLDRAT